MIPTVLVVDDDTSNRETLQLVFEDLPYPVLEARDANRALDLVRSTPESMVVVFDLLLPCIEDSVSVLKAVREDETLAKRLAVVAITASPRRVTPEVSALLDELSAPLVLKPFDLDALLDTVTAAARRLEDRIAARH